MEDINNLEPKKQKKPKTFEEWEASHNFKDVDPKLVSKAILAEYDNREQS